MIKITDAQAKTIERIRAGRWVEWRSGGESQVHISEIFSGRDIMDNAHRHNCRCLIDLEIIEKVPRTDWSDDEVILKADKLMPAYEDWHRRQ